MKSLKELIDSNPHMADIIPFEELRKEGVVFCSCCYEQIDPAEVRCDVCKRNAVRWAEEWAAEAAAIEEEEGRA